MEKPSRHQKETIAVIGGGMTGITAAMKLAESGRYEVTLFEKADKLGGLSSSYTWEDITWDRFYHVVLSTDTVMLDFLNELKLVDQLLWTETRSGFYGQRRLVSMSSTMDFIRFPFMTMWQKFRMALGILYSGRIKDPDRLDKIYVREWLTRVFGRRVYENIWEPLLRSKLGDAREKMSGAFIWATINRLYGARGSGGSKKELMGHVKGGYAAILDAAEKKLNQLGVDICIGSPIDRIDSLKKLPTTEFSRKLLLFSGKQSLSFDKVLLTIDCPEVIKILRIEGGSMGPYWEKVFDVSYMGVICLFLVIRHSLSPYYVINLLDKDLPFTGIVEVTNVVDSSCLGGRHIVYLPKYVTHDDQLNNQSDQMIIDLFIKQLKRVFPMLDNSAILHCRVLRDRYVQPIQKLNSLNRTIGYQTPVPNLYLCNTSMIHNSTLNNNAVIKNADAVVRTIMET